MAARVIADLAPGAQNRRGSWHTVPSANHCPFRHFISAVELVFSNGDTFSAPDRATPDLTRFDARANRADAFNPNTNERLVLCKRFRRNFFPGENVSAKVSCAEFMKRPGHMRKTAILAAGSTGLLRHQFG